MPELSVRTMRRTGTEAQVVYAPAYWALVGVPSIVGVRSPHVLTVPAKAPSTSLPLICGRCVPFAKLSPTVAPVSSAASAGSLLLIEQPAGSLRISTAEPEATGTMCSSASSASPATPFLMLLYCVVVGGSSVAWKETVRSRTPGSSGAVHLLATAQRRFASPPPAPAEARPTPEPLALNVGASGRPQPSSEPLKTAAKFLCRSAWKEAP